MKKVVTDGDNVTNSIYVNAYLEVTITQEGLEDPVNENTFNYYLGSKLIAVKKGEDLKYVLQDHLGSTSTAVDINGENPSIIKYFPFGLTRPGSDTMPTDQLFTGQRLDDNTGLYFYNARYYDPVIGRFISADTIVPDPANPQTLNRYSYCLNNPLKYIDPSGHDSYTSTYLHN